MMHLYRSAIAIAAATALCSGTASAADTLYVTTGPISPSLQTIDTISGGVTSNVPITGQEALFGGLAWDGINLYSIDGYNDPNSDRTFVIDPATGTGGVVGNTGFNWNFRSVEMHPANILYGTTDNALYTLSRTTGAATLVNNMTGGGGQLDQVTAIAINSSGHAYVTDIGNQSLFRLNLSTGALMLIGQLNVSATTGWFQDLAFDSSGQLWGVWWQGGMYHIDTTNATYTLAFNSGAFAGIAFEYDCGVTGTYCTAKVNSLGCTPSIATLGLPSATGASGFFVSCTNVRNNKSGLLFYGVNGQSALPFQGGTLCVASQIRRTPSVNSGGAPLPADDCSGVYVIDMNLFAQGGLGGNPLPALTVAGTIVDCQWWGRDQGFAPPNNTTLSNGLNYKICP